MNERPRGPNEASVRPLASDQEAGLLEQIIGGEPLLKHRRRYQLQLSGEGTYFVAWRGALPAGHLLVRWTGTVDREAAGALHRMPVLEDFFVLAEHRRLGLGRRLLEEAEALAMRRGCTRIGLAVGLTPMYEDARRLYTRRGFHSVGFSRHYASYWTSDARGVPVWVEEAAEYLAKTLGTGECR